jgi:hypothetical protein
MTRRRLLGVLLITIALAGSGCGEGGPKGAKVTGSVTMGGAPQGGARLGFIPVSSLEPGAASTGAVTGEDGKFEVLLLPGKYKVTLSRMVDKGGKVPGDSEDPSQDFAQLEAAGMLRQTFPQEYTSPESTPVSVDIPPEGKALEPIVVGQ